MKTAEIKRRYLAHFEANGHTVVPSAPLPAIDDPNLLFVNAGMVPFKPYFLGQETPPFDRAVSVQKCVRTLDIEEVGKTTRHGTFFQMNGNFSFGDYFKEGAIKLAWELSTKPVEQGGFGMDPERIWPTVYLDDDEAYAFWRAIGVPDSRIVRRGKKDNYWHMGIPGPAGPCSELFYDRGPEYGRDGGPEVDEDRYREYWNLVFMQYEITDVKSKEDFTIVSELPNKNIDTGMGLERIASILQGVDNLYEIDEVRPILTRAAEMTGKRYGAHSGHAASESHPDDVRLRVIADHVRTALMLIGDGIVRRRCPSCCRWRATACRRRIRSWPRSSAGSPRTRTRRRTRSCPRCGPARRSWTRRSRRRRQRAARVSPATRRSSCTTRTASRST